jgi:transcriptional regulator with XRE-family HTH domain
MATRSSTRKLLGPPDAPLRVVVIGGNRRMGAGLAALRKEAHLTQAELAERIGTRAVTVGKVEGSGNLTMAAIERYVRALGGDVEIHVVLDGRRTAFVGARLPKPRATKRAPKKTTARPTA